MIECDPAVKVEVENVAWPALNVPEPIPAAPSKNVTLPVGAPEALETVAVKVTVWPAVAGFSDEVTDVLDVNPITVCVRAVEVLASKVASPW